METNASKVPIILNAPMKKAQKSSEGIVSAIILNPNSISNAAEQIPKIC
jgi:hypothetical protein